jgi:hypothetical protein
VRPDFLVLGAQRAGTTWLDRGLRAHPAIYLPTRRKELHFFDQYYDRGTTWYESFFDEASAGQRVGEITPKYLFDPDVPARIATHLPHARLIAILRHPVDRAHSQYALAVRDDGEARPFSEYARVFPDAFERGYYAAQLSRYFERFAREQILVLLFEEVIARPEEALLRIAAFLDVDPAHFPASESRRVNESYRPRFPRARATIRRVGAFLRDRDLDWFVNVAKDLGVPEMFGNAGRVPSLSAAERGDLLGRYGDDIAALEKLLERDLSVWTASAEVVS